MDERSLRHLLERATVPEPPIGPLARNALAVGLRLRRRRRLLGTAAGTAAVAVICAAVAAVSAAGRPAAAPVPSPAAAYVLGGGLTRGTVTPISTATNTPGEPVVVRSGFEVGGGYGPGMALAPNGKTLWVVNGGDTVTPISTATKAAGKPIKVVYGYDEGADQVVISPDGKTVYVYDTTGTVTPISTATNRPGRPIRLGIGYGNGAKMAITPDGKTLYVLMFGDPGQGCCPARPSYLVPIATATNRAGRRIRLDTLATAILIPPDGETAYIVGQPLTGRYPAGDGPQEIEVIPVATATSTPGKPISTGATGYVGFESPVVMTQDGKTLYIADNSPNGVIPFSTVTNTPGKLIRIGDSSVNGILGLAVTPDGRTAYATSELPGKEKLVGVSGDGGGLRCTGPPGVVTPIATATGTPGEPIRVGCVPLAISVTPDGKTAYVASLSGTVTPIATATDQPGKPIKIEQPQAITFGP